MLMRCIQVLALCVGVGGFGVIVYTDPAGQPPTQAALFMGGAICGFGLMWLVTFLITWVRYGMKAARSMEWY